MITTRLIGALVEEDIVRHFASHPSFRLDLQVILANGSISGNNSHQDFTGCLVEELIYTAFADANGFIHINAILQMRILDMDGNPVLDQNGLPTLEQ